MIRVAKACSSCDGISSTAFTDGISRISKYVFGRSSKLIFNLKKIKIFRLNKTIGYEE